MTISHGVSKLASRWIGTPTLGHWQQCATGLLPWRKGLPWRFCNGALPVGLPRWLLP